MKKLYGVTVPLVTPFTEADKVDTKSLEALTEYLVERGVQCLYPAGTTGEMMYLGVEERKAVAETVTQKNAGRAVVYVHAGAWNLSDTLTLARHAVEIGADGIGVVTPTFFKLTDRELLEYYRAVSESVPEDFPIYLYGIPQCAVNDITVELARELAASCPNVIGIKYSFNDMSRIQQFMTLKEESFSVLCGPDDLFAATCFAGGDGTVSGNANVIPEQYEALWQAIREKDVDRAVKLQRRVNTLNQVLSCTQNIARYKVMRQHRGILATAAMRAPLARLAREEAETMIRRMEQLRYLEA